MRTTEPAQLLWVAEDRKGGLRSLCRPCQQLRPPAGLVSRTSHPLALSHVTRHTCRSQMSLWKSGGKEVTSGSSVACHSSALST
jgi:hypothetical protein